MYTIETKEKKVLVPLLIGGNRKVLTKENRNFVLCVLNNRTQTPTPQNGFTLTTRNFPTLLKIQQEENSTVVDELGNIYFEIIE